MPVQKLQIYHCEKCGIVVESVKGGGGVLVCCGQPMNLVEENTTDAAVEKHVPVLEQVDGGVKVTVGSVPHPMDEDHYIEWIEVIAGDRTYFAFLSPGDKPEVFFPVEGEELSARAYCNLHGLWKAELK